jgi:hypothetical protein
MGSLLQSVAVVDAAKTKTTFDILFFAAPPTIASTNNAALNIADAEMLDKFIGKVSILTADYVDISGSSFATVSPVLFLHNRAELLKLDPSISRTSVWVVLLAKGAGTYGTAGDLNFKIGLKLD